MMSDMYDYHRPVMLDECIEAMELMEGGAYVDVTFGAGGHSRLILENIGENGRLYGFDQDEEAHGNGLDDERFQLVKANFRFLKRFLRLYGLKEVDGVLADLGVSSHQFDTADRGFSYRFDAELDMRMNTKSDLTAAIILNKYREEELVELLSKYGEVRNSKTLAKAIVARREQSVFRKTKEFVGFLDTVRLGAPNKYYAQVFQALRIEVNDEMGALEDMLIDSLKVLKKGGNLVVLTYHSIEDRMVKNFMKTGNIQGEMVQDDFGRIDRPFKLITRKPLLPSNEEMKRNSRSRSAKLRIARKI